jgi:hypothetical protein
MESVKSTSQTTSQQGVAAPTPTPSASSGNAEFDKTLKVVLGEDPAKKVSEEDLFSALVLERFQKTKGADGAAKFKELVAAKSNDMRKADGYVPIEDATKAAIIEARQSGLVSKEEADNIYSQAFAAAQLDDNKGALFDGRGDANDATIAVASMEQALVSSRGMLEKFDAGSEAPTLRSVDEASNGKGAVLIPGAPTGADQGFLYKPTSESDGKLVVLLPSRLSGLVAGVQLFDPAGKLLDAGRYSGVGNGGREHFRFSQSGGSYPDGVKVEVSLKTGEKVSYVINDSGSRTENIAPSNGDTGSSDTGSGQSSDSGSSSSDSSTSQDDNSGL